MAKLLISSITEQSQKLGDLANQINNSGISKKDEWIDDKEFFKFKQSATALKNKGEISQKEFNAIFGLVIKDNTKSYTSSYENYKKSEVQKEEKEKEIVRLKKDINNIREKLYKGRYSSIIQKQNGLTESQKDAAFGTCSAVSVCTLGLNFFGGAALGISSIEALGISTAAATSYAGFLGAGAATLTAGAVGAALGVALPGLIVAGGCYLYNKYTKDKDLKFIQQCQQENPELYNALKQAEKQLAELQK